MSELLKSHITIIAPTFNQMENFRLPAFVYSVLAQSFANWKLIIAHDGPSIDGTKDFMEGLCQVMPGRIRYFESEERQNCWGHDLRERMLHMVDTEWTWLQNGDNLITCDAIKHFEGNFDCDVIYFPIIHNYFGFTRFKNWFSFSQCDLSQFITRTELAQRTSFVHRDFAADGNFIEDLKRDNPSLRIIDLDCILSIHQ